MFSTQFARNRIRALRCHMIGYGLAPAATHWAVAAWTHSRRRRFGKLYTAFLCALYHLRVMFLTDSFAFLDRRGRAHSVAVFVALLLRHHLIAVDIAVADLLLRTRLILRERRPNRQKNAYRRYRNYPACVTHTNLQLPVQFEGP